MKDSFIVTPNQLYTFELFVDGELVQEVYTGLQRAQRLATGWANAREATKATIFTSGVEVCWRDYRAPGREKWHYRDVVPGGTSRNSHGGKLVCYVCHGEISPDEVSENSRNIHARCKNLLNTFQKARLRPVSSARATCARAISSLAVNLIIEDIGHYRPVEGARFAQVMRERLQDAVDALQGEANYERTIAAGAQGVPLPKDAGDPCPVNCPYRHGYGTVLDPATHASQYIQFCSHPEIMDYRDKTCKLCLDKR